MSPRGGKIDPRATPAYSVAEAARYLSIPTATLRSWFAGISGHFVAVIRWEDSRDRRLSFSNLVEAHVLRALRTRHGISMPAVRKSIRLVQKEYGIDRLLIDPGLRAIPGKMFLKSYSDLVELPPSGQHVLQRVFDYYLEAVVQDPSGVPLMLYPWIPDPTAGPKKSVLINPAVSFGRPVTASRGVTTAVLADQFDAGATISHLSEDYGLSFEAIEDALAFERAAA